MSKFLELEVGDYIREVYKLSYEGSKIYLSSEKNAPLAKERYDMFVETGETYSFFTWGQFIASIVDFGRKGVKLNIEKTVKNYELRNSELDRVIVVEYLPTETVEVEDVVVEAPVDSSETLISIDLVEGAGKDLKAVEFKEWLVDYLSNFPEVDYEVDQTKGVAKLIKEIKDLVK